MNAPSRFWNDVVRHGDVIRSAIVLHDRVGMRAEAGEDGGRCSVEIAEWPSGGTGEDGGRCSVEIAEWPSGGTGGVCLAGPGDADYEARKILFSAPLSGTGRPRSADLDEAVAKAREWAAGTDHPMKDAIAAALAEIPLHA